MLAIQNCQVLLYFMTEDGLRMIRNVSKQNMHSFLKAFLVLIKLLSLSPFYAPNCNWFDA